MKRALIGAGGHAREVMMQMQQSLPCFVDDQYVDNDTLPLSQFNPTQYEVMIAIGNSESRLQPGRTSSPQTSNHSTYSRFMRLTPMTL